MNAGVEQIERVIKGEFAADDVTDISMRAEDWNGLVRSCCKEGKYQEAAFMIDICDIFFQLNELQRQRLQQVQIESYSSFFPILQSFCRQ